MSDIRLVYAFMGGMLFGVAFGIIASMLWAWADRQYHQATDSYPRKTSMPKSDNRVTGRPTNIHEPPAEVRQAQFRARKQQKD